MHRNDLPAALKMLVEKIHNEKQLTPGLAKQVIREAQITPDMLSPWADFSHPKADSYGRNLVYSGGFFELMVMSWADGDMSSIHDHGYTQWGAVQVFGPAEHAIFKKENGTISTAERVVFEPGTIVAVGHDLIHQMGNLGNEPYLTMHLYGCYGRDGDVTADARLYDLDEGKVQFTSGGVFFDLPEDAINNRKDGARADFPTWLRNKIELLRRLRCKNQSSESQSANPAREQRLLQEIFSPELWQNLPQELAEMENANPTRKNRYSQNLDQELFATAKYQIELAEDGAAPEAFNEMKGRLRTLVEVGGCENFAAEHLSLISEVYNIDFPVSLQKAA